MFYDELRQQAEEAEYEQNPLEEPTTPAAAEAELPLPIRLGRPKRILGMTGPQRLFIVVLLLFEVFLLGSMLLLVTQKIVPPIFQ